MPLSKGFKANQSRTESASGNDPTPAKHTGGGRELHPRVVQTVVAQAKSCPHCGSEVEGFKQSLIGISERIELPLVNPYITQVHHYGGTCECCQKHDESPVPVGLKPGSPFGMSVASGVTYLRYSHAVSYQWLTHRMAEMYVSNF